MKISRDKAFQLLKEYVQTASLLKHVLAVEGAMRGYARKYGENEEYWAALGLLHDLDFEQFPEEHPRRGAAILREKGYPDQFVQAVIAHAENEAERPDLAAKVLFAVDELSSFVVACVLVRPDKSFDSLKVKSVKKKLKDKGFARAVDRDVVQQGADELGVELSDHIQTVIDALREREGELRQEGLSLID